MDHHHFDRALHRCVVVLNMPCYVLPHLQLEHRMNTMFHICLFGVVYVAMFR